MPFEQTPLRFHRNDTEQVVSFKDLIDGPPPWVIDTVTTVFAQPPGRVPPQKTVTLKVERWKFKNVGQSDTDSNQVVGTLTYDPAQVVDATLDAIWAKIPVSLASVTITLNVICNGQSRPLTVELVP